MNHNEAPYATPVLTYHSLDDSGSVISTSPEKFREQLEALSRSGTTVVKFRDLALSVREKRPLPTNAVAITFDDGFRSVYDVAFPLLKEYDFPATVFLVTNFCGKDNRWDGQSDKIPVFKLLDWDQIIEMSSHGIEFGVHTASHPDLSKLTSTQRMADEIMGSRDTLYERLGHSECAFAYPYGKATAAAREIVESNFYAACSTRMEFVSLNSDVHFLPRVDMYYFSNNKLFSKIGTPYFNSYVNLRKALRAFKQRISGD